MNPNKMKQKIQFTIPQEIVLSLCRQLYNLEATPCDQYETAGASYEDNGWFIECSLKYKLRWWDDDDPGGRISYSHEATPVEIFIDKCQFYADDDSDDYIDYSDQLYDQLFDEIKPEI